MEKQKELETTNKKMAELFQLRLDQVAELTTTASALVIANLNDVAGYKAMKEYRISIKNQRLEVDKKLKTLIDPLEQQIAGIKQLSEMLLIPMREIEKGLDEQEKAHLKAVKEDQQTRERDRLAKIENRVNSLKSIGYVYNPFKKEYEARIMIENTESTEPEFYPITNRISLVEIETFTDEAFEGFFNTAAFYYSEELRREVEQENRDKKRQAELEAKAAQADELQRQLDALKEKIIEKAGDPEKGFEDQVRITQRPALYTGKDEVADISTVPPFYKVLNPDAPENAKLDASAAVTKQMADSTYSRLDAQAQAYLDGVELPELEPKAEAPQINGTDVFKHLLLSLSAEFPIVWDRYTHDVETQYLTAFGWIGRKDTDRDFVLIEFQENWLPGECNFFTSSDKYSHSLSDFLYGPDAEHNDCIRIEELLTDNGTNPQP